MELDNKVVDFIKKHHVLTLSTSIDNKPYSANCFYTYYEKKNILIFTSEYETKHINDVKTNNYVSGSIVLETSVVGKIQGIQFNGYMYEAKDEVYKEIRGLYLKKFPFAVLKETPLWYIDLTFIKMTDNRLGFGKKIIWQK